MSQLTPESLPLPPEAEAGAGIPDHYRRLADLVPEQVWTALPDGRLDSVNERVLAYFGRSERTLLEEGWQDVVHPDDLPLVLERWTRSLETGEEYQVEFRLAGRDGVYRWHIARARPYRDGSGRIVKWFGSNADVDDLRRTQEALRAREEREHFLAEASRVLSASLDYRSALPAVASVAVPTLGDFCYFDVVGDDGLARRVAWRHASEAQRPWFDDVQRTISARVAPGQPLSRVLTRGEALFVPEVDDEWMRRAAGGPEQLEFMRRLGFHSLIALPLRAPSGIVGAMTLGFSESSRRYTEADLALAEALASRTGIAIENTRLYEGAKESRERLLAALSASATGTFRWDFRTGVLDWDVNLDRLFGVAPGRTVRSQETFLSLVHPEDRPRVAAACRRCAEEGASFEEEFRVVWRDGSVRWLMDTGKTHIGEDGTPAYMTGACVDVTEQRQREEEFRALAESLPQLAWMADSSGSIYWYNRRWYDYTGTTREEMAGWGWTKVHHPLHVDRVVERIQHSWDTGEPWEDTFPLRGRDGEYRWFLSRALPIRGADGQLLRWFGTNTDITSLREAEIERDRALAEVERANRSKSDFLAAMSHDLRTPLNAISGYSSLVADGIYGPVSDRQIDAMRRIRRASSHLLSLVDDILGFAKVEAGSIALRLEEIGVEELLDGLHPLVEPQLVAKGLDFERRRGAPDVRIRADRERATQVLVNLLANAVKFTARGSVAVRWERDDSMVAIHVHDTGRGIPPDRLKEIFEPFVQTGHGRHEGERQGVGLGLAIGRQLARLMGGDLEVSSEPGRGSTFTFRLPRAAGEHPRSER